jgi:hypothetical protein
MRMVSGKMQFRVVVIILLLIGLSFSLDLMNKPALGNQLGGFIKKRVKDVVKQPDSGGNAAEEQSGANDGPRFNDRVLELNEATLSKLEKALLCERKFRDDIEAKYAKMPTKEAYQACSVEVMMSSEGQALAAEGADPSKAQQYMKKLMALLEKKCGKNPENVSKSDDMKPAEEQCSREADLTPDQYSIAKERFTPFCSSGGKEKVQGYGSVFFIYSPAEVQAMKPKCERFMDLMKGISGPR